MSRLTIPPDSDPRLMVGAYVSRGAGLFRVHSKTASQVVLEDCFRSSGEHEALRGTSRTDVLANYKLEREAV